MTFSITQGQSPRLPIRKQKTYRPNDAELIGRREAAAILGVSVSTMNQWAMAGKGPKFLRLGAATWYRRADVYIWQYLHSQKTGETEL